MLEGGENHFLIMQVTFCQIRHLKSFTVAVLEALFLRFHEQMETEQSTVV